MAGGQTGLKPAFRPGQAVRVRTAFPPGHVRTPHYVRGRRGVVGGIAGSFADPEERAYGRDGLPERTLYRVVFRQTDLWPDYGGAGHDTTVVDVFEHWLDPLEEKTR